ncbi:MAG: TolC family protein [Burkholderiaceae bacterium]|nr:TolC family protein [Burkholderiaceae bacterium]
MKTSPSSRLLRVVCALAGGVALCCVTGCAVRTPFVSPASHLPDTWTNGAITATDGGGGATLTPVVQALLSPDARLRGLLEQVESSNQEFTASALKLHRAQLQSGLADIALWPQPTVGANMQRSRPLDSGAPTARSQGVNMALAYEVDLWSRLGSERDMAQWEARASAADRRNLRITLLATAATLYFRLGLINEQIRANTASLSNARRVLELVQAQYTHGVASALELAEARQVVQSEQASAEQLVQLRVEARNALGVLADGRDLSAYEPDGLPERAPPPAPAGLPAALLSQRPDLQAAELRLRRSLAAVDAARASFYPSLNLTLSGGSSSEDLRGMLSNPVGTLAASLALPFVNAERARLSTAVARTEFDEAVLVFQQSLLTAFAEVDNALSAGVQLAREGTHRQATLADARTAERLYEARYREGAVALRDWLAAQNKRRQAEVALLENRQARLVNAVATLKALGIAMTMPVGERD